MLFIGIICAIVFSTKEIGIINYIIYNLIFIKYE